MEQADRYVFSRAAHVWEGLDPARTLIVAPSIDAFSAKNQDLSEHQVDAILKAAGAIAGTPGDAPTFIRGDGSIGHVDRAVQMLGVAAIDSMVRPGRDALEGIVEVDVTLIGGVKPGKRGRGADGKALVAIGVEVHETGPGRVRMRRIIDASADTLTDFVLDNVARGAEVHTDGWGGYNDIGRYRFRHVVTNISASGDPAHVVMLEVHRVASLLKRWLLGTHQGAVSHDQLDYYLDEFTFRFNRRRSRHRGLLFYRLLEGAMSTSPHPYNSLTSESAA